MSEKKAKIEVTQVIEKKSNVQEWIDTYEPQFEKYFEYCKDNNWVYANSQKSEFEIQRDIVLFILGRIKYFADKFESYLGIGYVKKFINLMTQPILLFLDRCDTLFDVSAWETEPNPKMRKEMLDFSTSVMVDYSKVKDALELLNLQGDTKIVDLPIHSDKKIPILMQELMEKKYPEIIEYKKIIEEAREQDKLASKKENVTPSGFTAFDVMGSSDFFINCKNPPPYDKTKHYFEQEKSTLEFYEEERRKLTEGLTIAGVRISPLLYWHTNYYVTDLPMSVMKGTPLYIPNRKKIIYPPPLRDNEIYFYDMYERASKQNVGVFYFGTRRYAKALNNKEKVLTPDGSSVEIGNLKVGDFVVGVDGNPTKVIGVHPQGIKRLYKVHFEDGRVVEACGEHLWKVFNLNKGVWEVKDTDALRFDYREEEELEHIDKTIVSYNYYTPIATNLYLNKKTHKQRYQELKELLGETTDYISKWKSYKVPETVNIENLKEEIIGLGLHYVEEEPNVLKVRRKKGVYITHIEESEREEATCITVDSKDRLFVLENKIVTHNTVLEGGVLSYGATMIEGSENIVIGGSAKDLTKVGVTLEIAFNNIHPAFSMPRNKSGWKEHVQLGFRDKNNKSIVYSNILIINVVSGGKTASEKAAGVTPTFWICDEGGKFNIKTIYEGAIPSFETPDGWGATPILVGCVCKGTKVIDREGKVVNIEDLHKKNGISGFDGRKVIPEKIGFLKRPELKECYRITTADGTELEASYDHYIMKQNKKFLIDKYASPKIEFKKLQDLKVGDVVVKVDTIGTYGIEKIENAYHKGIKSSNYTQLPEDIHTYSRDSLIKFLRGVFSVRGTHRRHYSYIKFDKSFGYIEDIKLQFQKIGIHFDTKGKKLSIKGVNILPHFKSIIEENQEIARKKPTTFKFDFDIKNGKGEYFKGKELSNLRTVKVIKVEKLGEKEVYNLNTTITNTYFTNGFISHNTGGNKVLSKEAQEMLTNPKQNRILDMDWEYLRKLAGEDNVTWKPRQFGVFLPAQMSYKTGLKKIEKTLSEYYNIDDERLNKINIRVTDWENSFELIKEARANLSNNRSGLAKEKMYFPIDPFECFLNRVENPFPADEAKTWKYELEQEKPYELVDMDWDESKNEFTITQSSKELITDYPFGGGNHDAPILMIERPPEIPIFDGTYVAGLDHYKHDKSSTDSIGSLVIFKRNVNIDEHSNCVVCTYSSRPNTIDDFNKTVEMLLEAYGAKCLQESADISFLQYARMKGKEYKLLAEGEAMARKLVNPSATQNNKFGLNANKANKDYYFKLIETYTKEQLVAGEDTDGRDLTIFGVTRIKDPMLLQELIDFDFSNADRIVAFGHALVWARYLDSIGVMPEVQVEITEEENKYKAQQKKRRKLHSRYGIRRNPYHNMS